MVHEHAITYTGSLTVADLDYMIKKANNLGKCGRNIIRIHEEADDEGIHVYFSVTGMQYGQRRTALAV